MSLIKANNLFLLLALVLAFLLLFSSPVLCDEEDDVFQGINSYRSSNNLRQLTKNKQATCVADQIADKIEDNPCPTNTSVATPIRPEDYPGVFDKCGVNVNHTGDGVILPVCVRKLVTTLVLTNYTQTQNAKYLNDTKFSGAGLSSEDDWMVLVLTTDTPGGTFAGANSLFAKVGFGRCLFSLLLGMVVYHLANV